MQQLIDFKKKHPILFLILLPLILVASVFLFKQSDDVSLDKEEKSDSESKQETEKIKEEAKQLHNEAKDIQEKIDSMNSSNIDENWHLKK